MFYLSEYLEKHRDLYVARLRAIGKEEEAWNKWIEFFLTAISEQARLNAEKARTIMELYERLKRRVIEVTRSQFALPLLDQLFERPVFVSTHFNFDEKTGPSRQLISLLLRKLEDDKIIKTIRPGKGRRAKVMCLPELFTICEGKKVF